MFCKIYGQPNFLGFVKIIKKSLKGKLYLTVTINQLITVGLSKGYPHALAEHYHGKASGRHYSSTV